MTDVNFHTYEKQDAGLCGGDIASLDYMFRVVKEYTAFVFSSCVVH
jgi:hypothetical protein